ncbi:adenosylcobinamide-GDP ribazoletransferase [Marinobacterium aestuariivivens]|uniref:Adenosylcobinamide-GDP ribazoletransferase n=1 Tax=Marinobacterium aestuariivivens TaxID=1698799 RepID=A0ABW2A4M4_9GAMM
MSGRELLIAGAPALLCLLLIAPVLWLPLLLSLLALRFYLVRLFRRRLGGYTGDCLGATQQISEIAVYLVLSLPLGGSCRNAAAWDRRICLSAQGC